MGIFMTWEQFKIFMDVFQTHLRNVHHPEVILIGLMASILIFMIWWELHFIRLGVN